jgi:hypothetical protein
MRARWPQRKRTLANGVVVDYRKNDVVVTYPPDVAAEIMREAAMEDAEGDLTHEEWIAAGACVRIKDKVTVIIDSPVRYPGDSDQEEWRRFDSVPFV